MSQDEGRGQLPIKGSASRSRSQRYRWVARGVWASVGIALVWFVFGGLPSESTPVQTEGPLSVDGLPSDSLTLEQQCEGWPEALMRDPELLRIVSAEDLDALEVGKQLYDLNSLTLSPPEASAARALWWRKTTAFALMLWEAQEIGGLVQQRFLGLNRGSNTLMTQGMEGHPQPPQALPGEGLLYHWLKLQQNALAGPVTVDNPVLANRAGWQQVQQRVRQWSQSAPEHQHLRALEWPHLAKELLPALSNIRSSEVDPSGALLRLNVLARGEWTLQPVGSWERLFDLQTPDFIWTLPATGGQGTYQIDLYDPGLYRLLAAQVVQHLLDTPARHPIEAFMAAEVQALVEPQKAEEAFCRLASPEGWKRVPGLESPNGAGSSWHVQSWVTVPDSASQASGSQASPALQQAIPYLLYSGYLSTRDVMLEARRRCEGIRISCPITLEAVQASMDSVQTWRQDCYGVYARQTLTQAGDSQSLAPEANALKELKVLDGPARQRLLAPALQHNSQCSLVMMDDLLRRWRGADGGDSAWSDVIGRLAWVKVDVAQGRFEDGVQELRGLSSAFPLLQPLFEGVRHSKRPVGPPRGPGL